MKVAAHAHGAEGIKRAVRNGVDSIEHGTFMDDECIRLMKEHGTHYVPTISAGRFVYEHAQDPDYLPGHRAAEGAAPIGPQIQKTFAQGLERGRHDHVLAPDTGVGPHGSNGKEFGYMVEAGMPVMDAIRSATMRPGEVPRRRRQARQPRGRGKIADIVAVPGDPLADVHTLGARLVRDERRRHLQALSAVRPASRSARVDPRGSSLANPAGTLGFAREDPRHLARRKQHEFNRPQY